MNLDDIRRQQEVWKANAAQKLDPSESSSNPPLEESSAAPGVPSFPPVEPTATEDSSNGGKEPWGVHSVSTDTGIGIYYQAGPKRLYKIRWASGDTTDWFDVPSVSEILDILNKPGLPWWGMKVGVDGFLELLDRGEPVAGLDGHMKSTDEIVDLLTKNKLTVNHVRDKAGDRGTAVHDALELWAQEGIVPIPSVYAPDEQGYVEGLRTFIEDCNPTPIVSEVMVASPTFLYAGRFDLGCNINQGTQAITKSYPKRKPVVSEIPGGAWILDLKTSKGVYESHHLQLAAYRQANFESWDVEVDHTGIIHVFDDGRYELVVGKATTEDFLRCRDLYDTMKRLK